MTSKELTASGSEALEVVNALNSATYRILHFISKERLDVSTIAERLGFSEAHASEQIRMLEDLKLIEVSYECGKRGIGKMCALAVEKVIIVIKP